MRAMHLALMAVGSVVTFVFVTLLVTWLLEDVIYFSIFVGIPAGIIAAAAVAVTLAVLYGRRGDGLGDRPPAW